jgi:anti-sigma B factor antagonist
METFQKEYRGNVVVITVNLVSATLNDTNEFKGFMDELILLTECDVVVDLASCNHLDSTFIGALVMNYKKLKNKDRNMVLVEPNDQTKVFLTMNSLSKIFPLYPSVDVAVEDLLNRNMIEKNLTNGNHNFVLPKPAEEVDENNNEPIEINNNETANFETELESTNEKIQQNIVQEEVQELVPDEMEHAAIDNLKNNIDETTEDVGQLNPTPMNEISSEETSKEPIAENNFHEETEAIDENKLKLEKFNPTNSDEQLVEEHDTGDRDYREGTLAWDFGL